MSNTPRLNLPEISSSQASKEITHNEALEILDALTQPGVTVASSPPGSPVAGSLYLITATATGAWAGYEGYIAQARGDSSWNLIAPQHNFWVITDSEPLQIKIYNANASPPDWQTISASGAFAFTDLTDVPASYSGAADKQVYVAHDEGGLEFRVPAGIEEAQDAIGAALTNTATVHATYLDAYNQMIWDVQDNSNIQKVKVAKAASIIGTRQEINLIEGSNVTLTVSDNAGSDRVDVTIAAAGGSTVENLDDLADVVITTPSTNQVLQYDGENWVNATGGGYTDEQAQDAVGSMLTDSSSIDFTYNDAYGTITAAVIGQPYVVGSTFPGVPANSQLMVLHKFPVAVTFPVSLAGSQCIALVAATAQTDFDVQKNGSSVGTIRWAAAGTVASYISASGASFAIGDVMQVIGPSSADATLADIGISLLGTRN